MTILGRALLGDIFAIIMLNISVVLDLGLQLFLIPSI